MSQPKKPAKTCSLDGGMCSDQYGAGIFVGCDSTRPCKNRRPKRKPYKISKLIWGEKLWLITLGTKEVCTCPTEFYAKKIRAALNAQERN